MTVMSRPTLPSGPIKKSESSEPLSDEHTVSLEDGWPLLPIETELYILPDGQVVVADLPAELQPLLTSLGHTTSSEIELPPGNV